MSMLKVDGVTVKTPSSFSWGIQDISDADSGRTTDGTMHKNRIAQKRKATIAWIACTKAETHAIMSAFNPEYVNATFWDPLDGADATRTFYVGDRTAPVKQWMNGNELYSNITFDIIER